MARKKQVKASIQSLKKGFPGNQKMVDNGTVNDINNIIIMEESGSVLAEVIDLEKESPQKFAFEVPDPPQLKDIAKDAASLPEQKYKWIWSLLNGQPKYTAANAHKDVGDGPSIAPSFSPVVEGGGLGWLEPFLPEGSPVNKIPNGYFIAAKGKPKVLSAEWREYNDTLDGKIITQTEQLLNNAVVLDIYTQGLYGQNIHVELLGRSTSITDWTDDNLPLYEQQPTELKGVSVTAKLPAVTKPVVPAAPNAGKPAAAPAAEETYKPEVLGTFFKRQVVIHRMLEDERSRGKKQVTDFLAPVEKLKDGQVAGWVKYNYVQKTTIVVYLDPRWMPVTGKHITKVYPKVKIPNKANDEGESLDDAYVLITTKEAAVSNAMIRGNVPVLVGDVPVNPQHYDPCKYTIIKVKDDKEHIIFDESDLSEDPKTVLIFDIVAGEDDGKQKITLSLENLQTNDDDCKSSTKHKGHVINIDPFLKAGYQVEDKKKGIKRTEDEKGSLKLKGAVNVKVMGNSGKNGNDFRKTVTRIVAQTDSSLVFDAIYNYRFKKDNGEWDLQRIFGYFWLPNAATDTYALKTQTCRWEHEVDFVVYPDIKWSLVFGFNVEKDQLQTLIPKWKIDKTIKSYEKNGEKVTKKIENLWSPSISDKERGDANAKVIAKYRERFGQPEKEGPKAEKPKQGKLSVLLDILKNVDVALAVQWNKDNEKVDITDDFVKSVYERIGPAFDLIKKAVRIIEGEEDKNAPGKAAGEKVLNEFIGDSEMKRRYNNLIESLKRPAQEVEIVYPKFSLGADWQYEAIDPESLPQSKRKALVGRKGLGANIYVSADPLIGVQITWHLLDLLCRKHPIAYAVLAAVKGILAALGGDPNSIKVDFWVKGTISGKVNFHHNMLAGAKGFTAQSDTSLQAGLELSIRIKGSVINGNYEAVGELGFGGGAEVGMGTQDTFGMDGEGFYIEKKLIFEGVKLKFDAAAEGTINKLKKNKKGKLEREKVLGVGGKVEGEIALGKHEFTTGKLYFKKT